MPREINGDRFLTQDEAARKLGVSSRTLKNYLNKGIVPKPGKIDQGLRRYFAFTEQWLLRARQAIESHREG